MFNISHGTKILVLQGRCNQCLYLSYVLEGQDPHSHTEIIRLKIWSEDRHKEAEQIIEQVI